MNWPDLAFTIGQWVLILALLPTVFSRPRSLGVVAYNPLNGKPHIAPPPPPPKPAPATSATTAATLAMFAATYFTLSLYAAAASTALCAALWGVLFVQAIRQEPRP